MNKMKRMYQRFPRLLLMVLSFCWLASCNSGSSDKAISEAIQANPSLAHVNTTVKDGVVTLTGEVTDEAQKAMYEAEVKKIKGVKEVVNQTTIAAPPPPPVVIAGDDALTQGVKDALKDFPSVSATVEDGVIKVTGKTSADNWKTIKMTLDGLHPKKVDATGLTIQ